MWDALRLILQILRVGRVRALFLVEGMLSLLVIADGLRYRFCGLSMLAAARHIHIDRDSLSLFSSLLVSIYIGLPLLFALIRLTFSSYSRHHGKLAREVSPRLSWLHLCLSTLLSGFSLLIGPMIILSGIEAGSGRVEFSFTPWFGPIAFLGGSYATLIGWFVVAVIAPTILTFLTRKTQASDLSREIKSRLCLLDLRSELYPVGYSPKRANFISGAISPGIEYVHFHGDLRVRVYDEKSPGSTEATEYLRGVAVECRDKVKRLFFRDQDPTSYFVNFTTSTTRALEMVLNQRSGKQYVLLSPFEHPAERKLLQWLSRQGKIVEISATYDSALLERPPSKVIDDIVVNLAQYLDPFEGEKEKVVLLLSEVCWATGVRVPVERVVKSLQSVLGWCPSVIIDGAHALGNDSATIPKIDHLECVDAYIFSGHKWLFSSAPIGVIVGRKPLERPFPVDVWREDEKGEMKFSTATAGPTSLCYFAAALDMFHEFNRGVMFERSRELRRRLRDACVGKFRILGLEVESDLANHSFIVSLAPLGGAYWKHETAAALRKHFDDRRVHVTVVRPHSRLSPAVRVTLPYFQNVRDLDMLLGALEDLRGG